MRKSEGWKRQSEFLLLFDLVTSCIQIYLSPTQLVTITILFGAIPYFFHWESFHIPSNHC